ncbi:DUF6808 domain-containing protein [Parabacteroides merdae]|uniref:DUF6808 domain-containing protein n=1 Tax=Parabacteroides merdae TaxID=46503 RepID=UPI0039B523BE
MKAWHVILLLLCMSACFIAGRHFRRDGLARTGIDTVIVIDTVRDTIPVPVRETVTKYIQVPGDTIVKYIKGDTVFLPIIQKEYSTPDYHAWVSGYNAALDSIDVFPKTVYVTKKIPARRWGLGVSTGYGVGRSGLSPYIGVGVYYRIW